MGSLQIRLTSRNSLARSGVSVSPFVFFVCFVDKRSARYDASNSRDSALNMLRSRGGSSALPMSRIALLLLALAPLAWAAELPPPATRPVDFQKDIAPLFEASCVK